MDIVGWGQYVPGGGGRFYGDGKAASRSEVVRRRWRGVSSRLGEVDVAARCEKCAGRMCDCPRRVHSIIAVISSIDTECLSIASV